MMNPTWSLTHGCTKGGATLTRGLSFGNCGGKVLKRQTQNTAVMLGHTWYKKSKWPDLLHL